MTEILAKYALFLLILLITLVLASGVIIFSLNAYIYIKEMIEEIKEIEK